MVDFLVLLVGCGWVQVLLFVVILTFNFLLGLVSAFLTFCFALLSHKFENLDGWLRDEHVECVFRADLTDSTDSLTQRNGNKPRKAYVIITLFSYYSTRAAALLVYMKKIKIGR